MQNYYAMVSGARRFANAQQNEREAEQFLDITQKQERGGEVAHSDTVKAQIQLVQRQRDVQEAQLALNKARIGFAVLLFPDFRQDFAVVDDLETSPALPGFPEIQALALRTTRISARPRSRRASGLRNQVSPGGSAPHTLLRLLLRH